MEIKALARDRRKLIKLAGFLYKDGRPDLAAISFSFEDNQDIFLCVDSDTDSLSWQEIAPVEFTMIALESISQKAQIAYGLHLAWVWEMTNHQGYFDALQIELRDRSLKNELVLQFKAEASRIQLFELSRLI